MKKSIFPIVKRLRRSLYPPPSDKLFQGLTPKQVKTLATLADFAAKQSATKESEPKGSTQLPQVLFGEVTSNEARSDRASHVAINSEIVQDVHTTTQLPTIFFTQVLSVEEKSAPRLPIAIEQDLAHFPLSLGKKGDTCQVALECLFDTGACLNVGYLPFHEAVARRFPECVECIYDSDSQEYSSIVLSGVVSGEEARIKISLPKVIRYYLPYEYRAAFDGQMRLAIALGDDVSVNTFLGISTMRSAGLVWDVSSNSITSELWDVPPISVVNKPPFRGIPKSLEAIKPVIAHTVRVGNTVEMDGKPAANDASSQLVSCLRTGRFHAPSANMEDIDGDGSPPNSPIGIGDLGITQNEDYVTACEDSPASESDNLFLKKKEGMWFYNLMRDDLG